MSTQAKNRWEHFHHVADIGVRGIGCTLAEAFEQAALAMTAVIVEPDKVQKQDSIEIEVSAADKELLLIEWLNALVYEMATRHMLFADFQVDIKNQKLRAKARGEAIDVSRHQPAVEIKGATFTELSVWQDENGLWRVQCVVDV